jgi:MFS family permease
MLRHFAEGAFGSRHLNLMNVHIGLVNFGQVLRMQISVVFFANMGLTPTQIFLLMAVFVGTRFIYRTPLMLVGHKWGSKAALIGGQIILALAFGLYTQIDGMGSLLWTAIILMSAGEALYWHAVHTTYAVLGEHGKFGRQLAARTIFMNLGGLAAPLATALLAGHQSWLLLFALAGVTVVISVIPLLFVPEPCPPAPVEWRKGFATDKSGMVMFLGSSMHAACMFYIWPLIMYLQFGSVEKFGSVMTATMLISFLLMIYVARRIDLGKAQLIVLIGPILYASVMMLLAWQGRDAISIMLFTALLDIAYTLYRHPYGAAIYRWSKEVQNPMWFCYWLEFGWDIGTAITLCSAALILSLQPQLDLRWLMLIALPGIAWCYLVYITDGKIFSRRKRLSA